MTYSLTELAIKALPLPKHGQKYYPDGALSGFGVRVSQGGTKTFVLLHGIRKQKILIGRHGTITLSKARAKARAILAEKTLGQYQAKTISFAKMRELFIANAKKKNRLTTAYEYERLLNRLQFDNLQMRPLDISRELKRFKSLSEQNHLLTALKAMLTFSVNEGYLNINPALSMPLPSKRTPRARILSTKELRGVWKAPKHVETRIFRIMVLCLLTGQRRGEIAHLRGEDIDYEQRIITIPADRAKNHLANSIPYGDFTASVLEELPTTGYLFPATRGKGIFNAWGKEKTLIDKHTGVTNWTLHDLRRTFATMHAEIGTPIHIIERLLNHSSGTFAGVTGTYNRFAYFPDMKAAALNYENHVRALLKASS